MKKNWTLICATAVLTVGAIKAGTVVATGLAPEGPSLPPVAATGQAMTPNAVAVDGDGNVYVADYAGHVVQKVTPGGELSVVAGVPGAGGTIVPGPALSSPLSLPAGLAVDGAGDLHLADGGTSNIVAKVASGGLSVVAGVAGQHGPITAGDAFTSTLGDPAGIAFAPNGDLIVADAANQVVVRIDGAGQLSVVAGIPGIVDAPTPGLATESGLYSPSGVAVDAAGNIYIADTGNHVVEKVDTSGNLSIVAGRVGSSGKPRVGPATATRIGAPAGIAVEADGTLYIADPLNQVVERVATDGRLTIAAGILKRPGAPTPGPATSSNLNGPAAVAVDGSGNLYIADSLNNVVEKVSGGELSIIAGTGTASPLTLAKNKAAKAINRRLASIQGLVRAVGYAPYLSDDDRQAALDVLTFSQDGLLALSDEITAAETAADAQAGVRAITGRYKLYVLVLPQVALAAAADALQYGALPQLTAAHTTLQALLAGPAQGANSPAVQAAMADLEAQLAVIRDRSTGVGATALGYTVADYRANRAVLQPAQADVAAASAAAAAADQDVLLVQQAIAASGYSSRRADSVGARRADGASAATRAAADLAASRETYRE